MAETLGEYFFSPGDVFERAEPAGDTVISIWIGDLSGEVVSKSVGVTPRSSPMRFPKTGDEALLVESESLVLTSQEERILSRDLFLNTGPLDVKIGEDGRS